MPVTETWPIIAMGRRRNRTWRRPGRPASSPTSRKAHRGCGRPRVCSRIPRLPRRPRTAGDEYGFGHPVDLQAPRARVTADLAQVIRLPATAKPAAPPDPRGLPPRAVRLPQPRRRRSAAEASAKLTRVVDPRGDAMPPVDNEGQRVRAQRRDHVRHPALVLTRLRGHVAVTRRRGVRSLWGCGDRGVVEFVRGCRNLRCSRTARSGAPLESTQVVR